MKKQKNNGPASLLPKILLLLFSVAAILLIGEIFTRVTFKKNLEATFFAEGDRYYFYDRQGRKLLIPNKVGYERLWDNTGKAEFRINEMGFRGPEISLEKREDTHRILFVGDSITLGGRLHEEDIFVSRLSESLNLEKDHQSYELINGGIGDIGLEEELWVLKNKGLALRPDLVILGLYLNDARPPVGFPEEEIFDHPVIKLFNRQPLVRKSYLAGWVYDKVRTHLTQKTLNRQPAQNVRFQWANAYMSNQWRENPEEFKKLVSLAEYDWGNAWKEAAREDMLAIILEMNRLAQEAGADFMVFALPVHAQIYAGFQDPFVTEPQDWFRARLEGQKIPFLDPIPALKRNRTQPIFFDQCHYTPLGNALLAETLKGFLQKNGLLR